MCVITEKKLQPDIARLCCHNFLSLLAFWLGGGRAPWAPPWLRLCGRPKIFFFFLRSIKILRKLWRFSLKTFSFFWDHIKIRKKLRHFPRLFWSSQNRRCLIFELTPGTHLALGVPARGKQDVPRASRLTNRDLSPTTYRDHELETQHKKMKMKHRITTVLPDWNDQVFKIWAQKWVFCKKKSKEV